MRETESTSPNEPVPPDSGVIAWLDGLTGRSNIDLDAADGARLRNALLDPESGTHQYSWSDIERQAGRTNPCGCETASNDAQFRLRMGGAVLVIVMVAGVLSTIVLREEPEPDQVFRGSGITQVTWRTGNPELAAQDLARDLKALGATVEILQVGGDMRVEVRAPQPAWDLVNARLLSLETALDAQGRLSLVVRPVQGVQN